jgi:hypothetical protein
MLLCKNKRYFLLHFPMNWRHKALANIHKFAAMLCLDSRIDVLHGVWILVCEREISRAQKVVGAKKARILRV